MPEVSTKSLGLDDLSPPELEQRRRLLVEEIRTKWGTNLDDAPIEKLHELAAVTSTLRKRNAGPPKVPKAARGKGQTKSLNDLLGQL